MPLKLPFDAWNYKEASESAPKLPDTAEPAAKFYGGDHWQEGEGWIGPNPAKNMASGSGGAALMKEIEAAFTSKNVIAEVVNRHMRGVIGREPGWTLVHLEADEDEDWEPGDAEEATRLEAEALLVKWWNDRRAHARIQEAVGKLLYQSRAPLRLYVPKGLMDQAPDGGTMVKADSPEAALQFIHLSSPDPTEAFVYEDPNTGWKIGVALLEDKETGKWAEISFQDPEDETLTVLRVLKQAGTDEYPALPFRGQTLVFEMARPPLITPQVMQSQKALNLALSMLPRNVVTGGFLERIILNGMPPGEIVEDADAPGGKRFEPNPMAFGAGIVNWIEGIPQTEETDAGDKERLTTPTVLWRDPVPVDTSIDAKDAHYTDILDEVDQAHVLLNSEAAPSGRSRESARADYEGSLDRTRTEVEAAGRWLLTTVLAMAETFGSSPGKYTEKLRVDFVCHLDAGPISVEERKQNVEEAKSGLLSNETAMSRNGVDDPAAERSAISAQDDAYLGTLERQATTMELLTRAGLSVLEAAELVGVDEEGLAIIRRGQEGDEEEGGTGTGFPVTEQ